MVSDLSTTHPAPTKADPNILHRIDLDAAFSENALTAAQLHYAQGQVRVVTANLRSDFAGIFGTVSVATPPRHAEVSVVVQRNGNQISVEGRSSEEDNTNGPHVLAVLLAARGGPVGRASEKEDAGDAADAEEETTNGAIEYYSDLRPVEDDGDDPSIDWFAFECGVEIGGRRINLLPAIIEYLQTQPPSFHPDRLAEQSENATISLRAGGTLVPFPARRLYYILSALTELHDPDALSRDGTLTLHPLRAAQVSATAPAGKASPSPHQIAARAEALRTLEISSATEAEEIDTAFQGSLRPYQAEGFGWLQRLRDHELGGVLADDMGLGKTVQTLCHLLTEKNSGRSGGLPSLIVAPKSVLHNWANEARKFTPSLNVLVLSGPSRKRYFSVLDRADLVVTSYPLLSRDIGVLESQPFSTVILDEAHLIKNSRSKLFKAACSIDARHRICLSGTPIENHLGELWSLFHFLSPGFLGAEAGFKSLYRIPIEKYRDDSRRRQLAERVAPFLLRRTKQEVATDLPPKTEIVEEIDLHPEQIELYEAVRASLDKRVQEEIAEKGFKRSKILVLDALLKLRQVCCHPRLVKLEAARRAPASSAKLERLVEMLTEMISQGRRVLIFSQFTQMLEHVAGELDGRDIPFTKLTGQTRDRQAACDAFQGGKVPVFLISLRAGGTGLNLTAADTVIHYDPWWNPALESQATDRAYRIGQKNPVFVYKLIARGTIEEKIQLLQQKKRALYEGILSNNAAALDFSEADLANLMAPMKPAAKR